jgi:hypothetical protein
MNTEQTKFLLRLTKKELEMLHEAVSRYTGNKSNELSVEEYQEYNRLDLRIKNNLGWIEREGLPF